MNLQQARGNPECQTHAAKTEETDLNKKGRKYDKTLPRQMYTYFASFSETEAPCFSKFAKSIGLTLAELESYRKHSEFDRAWRECNEIRRDYLIDRALTKRYDPSFVKFLLSTEFGMSDGDTDSDNSINVKITVTE